MKQQPFEPLLGINTPTDGFSRDEKLVIRALGEASIEQLYSQLPTTRMKAIAAMHYELGYNQELIARIFNVSQARISQELKLMSSFFLKRPASGKSRYIPRPPQETITLSLTLHIMRQVHELYG